MNGRKQIEDRRQLDWEERKTILEKSECKCARCGKPLKTSDMTVEHIIPLSKGGTYRDENLVALCLTCNQKKGSEILHPTDYFNYLKKEHMLKAIALYKEYLRDVPWYSSHNYTKEDIYGISYNTGIKGRCKKTKDGSHTGYLMGTAYLKRVYRDDFEEICEYVKQYNKKYGLDTSHINDVLEDTFKRGCIYKLCIGDNIVALLPFTIEEMPKTERPIYKLYINGIPHLYNKKIYYSIIRDGIIYVMECMSELNHLGVSEVIINIPVNDKFLLALMDILKCDKIGSTEDKKWEGYQIGFCIPRGENEMEKDFNYDEVSKLDENKFPYIISDSYERALHLPSLNKRIEKKKEHEALKQKTLKSKNKGKPKRTRKEIDEYDLEYYK